ncbi:MAG: hypothetical protein V4572_12095 [Bacteroidota bacterium]
MTIIKLNSTDNTYYIQIVPRYYTNNMTATIREKINNVTNSYTVTSNKINGVANVVIDDFTPVNNAKYEMILIYNNTIIWQGQICYLA